MRTVLALAGLALGTAFAVRAQTTVAALTPRATGTAHTVDERWRDSLDAFAAADRAHAPQPGGVLFVGSSSIRLWADLEQQFQTQPVIVKRGFGGSRMADCTRYLERLVLPYQPRLVIVYAGDNDLAEGRSPQDVLASFTAFVEGVHEALPRTRIAYLSIKPSPLREALLPKIQEANGLIAQYVAAQPELAYIDIFSKMLDADGHPRKELFSADSLHMNESGYALWKAVIDPFLRLPAPIPMSEPLSPPQSVSASAAASPLAGPSAH
jgi:lysophospholipase L1-like esterase